MSEPQGKGDLSLVALTKSFAHLHRGPPARPDHPAGLVLRAARPVGLWQDDDAAHDRRPRGADGWAHPHRRERHHRHEGLPAQRQHGLPELRPLPAHERARQRRCSACDGAATSRPRPRPTRSSSSCSWGRWRASKPDPALGRHAAARRPGARARQPPRRAAARRAARCARPQAAPPDADGAEAHPAGGRPDLHPRHPRPGGGHDDGRLHRGDERRPHRAARRPGHPLRAAAVDVRRQLPRAVQPRARAGSTPAAPTRSSRCAPTTPTSRSRATHLPDGVAGRVARGAPREAAPRRVRGAQPPARRRARRVVQRRRHAVLRGDAVGPGAHRRAAERRLARGRSLGETVTVSWAAEHGFALDASQAADAGADLVDDRG